ncbi:MAG TPA: nucleotidyltransferase family protein [Terriglobales bacterium]|jgi:D-glycero-alpha-D-manno-heptose 1-phosphate guanylyltransferase|nr:nucleotidyltransferase family protein [Terriglobales bacterium]
MTGDVKAVLLVGGLGTRLRSVVPSAPKVLASLGKKSFLELLIGQLSSQGIRRLVMCTGYLADQIEKEFGDGRAWDITIEYSKEEKPLGTAGAVKRAQQFLQDVPDFLVMNGDSFLEINFCNLMECHRNHDAMATMAVVRVEDTSRYGTVQVDSGGRVRGFAEKTGSEIAGLVNGGVYVFNQLVFQYIPEGPASLERDVFPRLLDQGVYALEQHGMFIDIGTPTDYARAQQLCDSLNQAAARGRLPDSAAGK